MRESKQNEHTITKRVVYWYVPGEPYFHPRVGK